MAARHTSKTGKFYNIIRISSEEKILAKKRIIKNKENNIVQIGTRKIMKCQDTIWSSKSGVLLKPLLLKSILVPRH